MDLGLCNKYIYSKPIYENNDYQFYILFFSTLEVTGDIDLQNSLTLVGKANIIVTTVCFY